MQLIFVSIIAALSVLDGILPQTTEALEPTCPEFCECTENGKLDCSKKSLTALPNLDYNHTFTNLDLSNNKIENLDEVLAQTYEDITNINLNDNLIETIPTWFAELKSLKHLQLSNNKISNFTQTFSMLEHLDLSYNHLDYILFSAPELKVLDIKGCNLTELQNEFLSNFTKIEVLDISENNLTEYSFLNSAFGNLTLKACNLDDLKEKYPNIVFHCEGSDNKVYTSDKEDELNIETKAENNTDVSMSPPFSKSNESDYDDTTDSSTTTNLELTDVYSKTDEFTNSTTTQTATVAIDIPLGRGIMMSPNLAEMPAETGTENVPGMAVEKEMMKMEKSGDSATPLDIKTKNNSNVGMYDMEVDEKIEGTNKKVMEASAAGKKNVPDMAVEQEISTMKGTGDSIATSGNNAKKDEHANIENMEVNGKMDDNNQEVMEASAAGGRTTLDTALISVILAVIALVIVIVIVKKSWPKIRRSMRSGNRQDHQPPLPEEVPLNKV